MNYFPLGIAKGFAFCNRVSERKQLLENIKNGKHTIVISPRRYGKSSLVLYTLDESKLLYESVDLFVAISAKTIEEQILKGVKNLLNRATSKPEQALSVIKNYIKSENLRFIFSGSNRHILSMMFDDRTRPLYSLCDRITIDRIHKKDYGKHINHVAKKRWEKQIDESTLEEIFILTEFHPYYMNVLCNKIWSFCENKVPNKTIIKNLWQEYILQEKSKIAKELGSLNTSQKKILIAISQGITKDLTSKSELHKLNFSSGAIIKSLKLLEEQDYINRDKEGKYFLVDPLIKSSLVLFYP